MDRYYARAYMTERIEAAERRRLIAAATHDDPGLSQLARVAGSITAMWKRPSPATPTLAVVTGDCVESGCCLA